MTATAPPRKIVIVDMDGTLADVSHRLHHLTGPKKNWKKFFGAMSDDPPSEIVMNWVKALAADYEVVIMTGRPEAYRSVTETWLSDHGVRYSSLLMRRDGDHRPDHVVKRELLDRTDKDRVAFVIDDRPSVCEMWRGCGLKVFQVSVGAEY